MADKRSYEDQITLNESWPNRRVTGYEFMTDKDRRVRRGISEAADKASEEDYQAYRKQQRKTLGYARGGPVTTQGNRMAFGKKKS